MASDATARQIENRRWASFAVVIAFLVLVVIILIFAIAKNFETEPKKDSDYAAEVVASGEQERTNFPIVKHLPFQNALFTLGYQFSDNHQKLTIKVKTTVANFDTAFQKLASFGEDLTPYALEVTRPENPFVSAYVVNDLADPTAALKQAYAKIADFQVQKVQTVDYEEKVSGESDSSSAEGSNSDVSNPENATVSTTHFALAVITTGRADHYSLCTYRLVLKFINQQWQPVANPAPVLNIYNMPGVPQELLRQANQL